MRVNDLALGVIVAAFGGWVILHVRNFPDMAGMEYGPAFFPGLIGGAFLVCGALLMLSSLYDPGRGPIAIRPDWTRNPLSIARAAAVIAAVVLYALLAPRLGFLLTVFLLTAGLLALMGVRARVIVPIALVLPVALHYGFAVALRVPLPRGVLEQMLF